MMKQVGTTRTRSLSGSSNDTLESGSTKIETDQLIDQNLTHRRIKFAMAKFCTAVSTAKQIASGYALLRGGREDGRLEGTFLRKRARERDETLTKTDSRQPGPGRSPTWAVLLQPTLSAR